ncbi:MAG: hypothetical protein ACI32C_04415 [Candidatus Enteromonas sp.]
MSSSLDPIQGDNIQDIKEMGAPLLDQAVYNDKGYAFFDQEVSFRARSFFYGNMISSASGAGNPYWSFVGDETGYIYAAIPLSIYQGNASKYAGQENQYFDVKGTLAAFQGQLIVEVTSYTFVSSSDFIVSNEKAKTWIEEGVKSFESIHSSIASMPLNVKGCAYGDPRIVEGELIAKMDDNVYLFSDGKSYLKVHGTKTAFSGLSEGHSYRLYVVPDEYIYAPGAELLFAESIDKVFDTPTPKQTITAAETYQWTYKNNVMDHASSYEGAFGFSYTIQGYPTYYPKDGSLYFVIADKAYPDGFAAYTNARDAKCLFLKNESENNLKTEKDLSYSYLASYDPNEPLEITFVPYLWNTNKYFQGYALFEGI